MIFRHGIADRIEFRLGWNYPAGGPTSAVSAYRDRLPWSIVLLLFLASVVPSYLMGQQQGVSQRPHLSGTLSFFVLVTLAIYVTLDLNQPTSGFIRGSQEPLERLLRSMSH